MRCPKCRSENVAAAANGTGSVCGDCGNEFKEIFVSYGHDRHADFVKRLAEAVEKRSGYTIGVWIDHIMLRGGDNWRREITDGIEKSYGVMAFLSKYAARKTSVCRDELAIAISSKNGMIKSVLLERLDNNGYFTPADEDGPTAPLAMAAEYQWADMSDYERHTSNEEDYEKYVNEKADGIIKMLESDEIKKYNGELAELRKKLALPGVPGMHKFERLLQHPITGRKWLFDKVEEWLDDKNGARILMLYGAPGSGKSMFSAHLQHYNPKIAASFACDYKSDAFSNTDNIISWLAYKLAMRIPEYRGRLLSRFSDSGFAPGNGDDRFRNLIGEPLCNSVNGGHAEMFVLIDAADEVKTGDLMRFVSENAEHLAPWLRFLITSRRDPKTEQRFASYPHIDFADYADNNEQDLLEYYKDKLGAALAGREGADEFYEKLVKASEGIFAYAEKVCENILQDLKKDEKPDLENYKLPHGLSELFRDTLDRKNFEYQDRKRGTLNFQGFWQAPLGMIVASPDPLPAETLKLIMGWRDNAYRAFISPLSTLIVNEDGRLTPFHRSFAEWLGTEGADVYHTSKDEGLYNLAEACFDLYGSDGVDALDEFIMTHLTYLLRETGMNKEYEKIKADEDFYNRIIDICKAYINKSLFTEAVAVGEELVTVYSGASDGQGPVRLAGSLDLLGNAYKSINDFEKALELYEEELNIDRQLVSDYPQNPDYKRGLSVSLDRVAGIYKAKNGLDKALELYEEVLSIRRRLVSDYPQNQDYKYGLSVSLEKVAGIYEAKKELDKALELYEEELNIWRQLVSDYPQKLRYIEDLAVAYYNVGVVTKKRGYFVQALETAKLCPNMPRCSRIIEKLDGKL